MTSYLFLFIANALLSTAALHWGAYNMRYTRSHGILPGILSIALSITGLYLGRFIALRMPPFSADYIYRSDAMITCIIIFFIIGIIRDVVFSAKK